MTIGRFQGGIAAVIWHPSADTYLLLRRVAHRDFGAGEWECVTGRVDQGESFEAALRREVWEEIQAKVTIEFIIGTTHFYRGEATPDNELLGMKYLCSIADPEAVVSSAEHSEFKWVTAAEIETLLPVTHWLRQTIQTARQMQALMPPELREIHRALYRDSQ
jgi:8-oxo-dGTP diphosphatase